MGKHSGNNFKPNYQHALIDRSLLFFLKNHKIGVTFSILGLLAITLSVVAGYQLIHVKNELTSAQKSAQSLIQDVKNGNFEAYDSKVALISENLSQTQAVTTNPIWKLGEAIPFVGENLKAISLLCDLGQKFTDNVLSPMKPVLLKPGGASMTDAAEISKILIPVFDGLKNDADRVSELNSDFLIPQLAGTVSKFKTAYLPVKPTMEEIGQLLPSVPDMLGLDGPKNYLLLLKTNSELTTQGGFALQKSVITLVDGKPQMSELTDNHDFRWLNSPVSITSESLEFYGAGANYDIAAFTQFANFSETGSASAQGYESQTGVHIDGVISMDPVALGYLLAGTQEVQLSSGDVINSQNAASLLLHDIYLRFPNDETDAGSNAFFAEAVSAIQDAFLSKPIDPVAIFDGFSKAISEHRIQMWSPEEKVQAVYKKLGAEGDLPTNNEQKVVFGSYLTDRSFGTKMDYFVSAETNISVNRCKASQPIRYKVTTKITNNVNADAATSFPTYVLAAAGKMFSPGSFGLISRTYGPVGAILETRNLTMADGEQIEVLARTHLNRQVGEANIVLAPGESATVTLDYVLPKTNQSSIVEIVSTPLAQTMKTSVSEVSCSP